MRNIIIILLLFCSTVGYSYNRPIHMNLNANYFESWADYNLHNIYNKYLSAAINNKIAQYSDEKLLSAINSERIKEKFNVYSLEEFRYDLYDFDGEKYDSFVYHTIEAKDFGKIDYLFHGDSIYGLVIYIKDSYRLHVKNNKNQYNTLSPNGDTPWFYFKWKDIAPFLKAEEFFTLNILLKDKRKNGHVVFDRKDVKEFAYFFNDKIEDELYKFTMYPQTRIYMSDSLKFEIAQKNFETMLNYYYAKSIPDNPNDTFGPSHDSLIFTRYTHSDSFYKSEFRILVNIEEEGGLKLSAASALARYFQWGGYDYNKRYTEMDYFGFIKESDFKLFLTKDEEKLLNYVARHALYIHADRKGYNENFYYPDYFGEHRRLKNTE